MSTAFDEDMAEAVLSILEELGVTATLSTVVRGTYSAAGGVRRPDTTTTTTLKASPPLSMVTARAEATRGGRTIGLTSDDVLATDLYVIIGTTDTAGAAVPAPSAKVDTLTVAGTTYTIHQVGTIYSGDDVAAYELHLRRS